MPSALENGYVLEQPALTVPWGLSRRQLIQAFGPHGLRKIESKRFVLSCTSLSGLHHEIEFRFDDAYGPHRYMLNLYSSPNPNQTIIESYEAFQRHLELTFGRPSSSEKTDEPFPLHRWELGGFRIVHTVYERFVLCENVAIIPPEFPHSLPLRIWKRTTWFFTFANCLFPRLMLLWLIPILLAILLFS